MKKTILITLALSLVLIFALSFTADAADTARGGPSHNLPERAPIKKVTATFPTPEASLDAVTGTTLTKLAVVIGISDYYGTSSDLNYCDDDAYEVYDTLVNVYGFPAGNIVLLIDGQATEANILAGIDWLVANSGPGSSVVFAYSGHGSRSNKDADGDPERVDECIVPWELSRLWDGTLAAHFAPLTSTNNWIYFDSCYSGGMTDIGDAGEIITMACAEKEYSYESSSIGHGYFTWLMVERGMRLGEADANGDGTVTVEEAFAFADANIGDYARKQNPVLKDGIVGEMIP